MFGRIYLNQGDGGGGGGAVPPTGGAVPPAAPPAAAPADFHAAFQGDAQGYVQNKGWKSPVEMLESYQNLEKLRGVPAERLLTLPTEADAPEAWNSVYSKLGRPDKPDGYELPKLKEGEKDDFQKWAREVFHGANLTKSQAKVMAEKFQEYQGAQTKQMQDAQAAKLVQEQGALKSEWGQAHDQNTQIASRAAKALGLDAPTLDKLESVMGYSGLMKLMHRLGTGTGEHNFVQGGSSGNGAVLSPGQAQAKIAELKSDQGWMSRYLAGGVKENNELQGYLSMMNAAG